MPADITDSKMAIDLHSLTKETFRYNQVCGMFDLTSHKSNDTRIQCDNPLYPDSEWDIGLIVGPSGCGKSTVAKKLFGEYMWNASTWNNELACIDNFETESIKEIVSMLTMVGFSSPPAWLRPYHVLSNGKQYRCELARALLADQVLVCVDEFTSVVDREVAKVMSMAVSKGIKKNIIKKKFVAVSCHYDITDWLQPDWVLDMATGNVARRSLRRPKIMCTVCEAQRDLWQMFRRHHYLSGNLNKNVKCYALIHNKKPIGFMAVIHEQGKQVLKRVHRLVILPDYQGIGLGTAFLNHIAEIYSQQGKRLGIVSSHPGIIAVLSHSPQWNFGTYQKYGHHDTSSHLRPICSFSYKSEKLIPPSIIGKKKALILKKG